MKVLLMFLAFAFVFPALLCLQDVAANPLPAPGPDGMITLPGRTRNGALYTVSSFKETFYNALEYCASTGRKLVSIEKLDEQVRISVVLSSNKIADDMWTSGIEIFKDNFIWASTFGNMTFKNIGYTNLRQTDNCLAIVARGTDRNKWWHYNCETELHFLCETDSTNN